MQKPAEQPWLAPPGKQCLSELPQYWERPPSSPLSIQQMGKVIKCMTNSVADPGTIKNKYFGMVIPGEVMGRQHDQAGICVDVGMGDSPSQHYPCTMSARVYGPVQILPCR